MVHSALFPEGSYLGRLHKEGYLGSLMPSEPFRGEIAGCIAPPTLPQTQISAKIGKDQTLGSGRGKGQGGCRVE